MVRTKHQQQNHQERVKLGARHARRTRIAMAWNKPRSAKFLNKLAEMIKRGLRIIPYKAPSQKSFGRRGA